MKWIPIATVFISLAIQAAIAQRSCCGEGGDGGCKVVHPHGCSECNGEYIRVCQDGKWALTTCGLNMVCVPGSGHCKQTCGPAPRSKNICSDDKPDGCKECQDDNIRRCDQGTWGYTDCGVDMKCVPGSRACGIQCVRNGPKECALGKPDGCKECQGDNARVCTQGGWAGIDCGIGMKCIPGSRACEIQCVRTGPKECAPGKPDGCAECQGDNVRKCTQGGWGLTDCGIDMKCVPGSRACEIQCVRVGPKDCEPGKPDGCKQCIEGKMVKVCKDGRWSFTDCGPGLSCAPLSPPDPCRIQCAHGDTNFPPGKK